MVQRVAADRYIKHLMVVAGLEAGGRLRRLHRGGNRNFTGKYLTSRLPRGDSRQENNCRNSRVNGEMKIGPDSKYSEFVFA
jgi:hypothetical protein